MFAFKTALFLLISLGAFGQQSIESKAPAQPIPFSHKAHASTGLKCQECHPNPDPGDHMTLPATARCMACHVTIAKDQAAIQKLAAFDKAKRTIPWARVYSVPAAVYWNHRSHLMAGVQCETCHGQVGRMETLFKATNVTTMDGCVECHRNSNAGTGCGYCHEEK